MEQELVGRGAAPLRIGRREVVADVAFADRAQHRVGDRVQAGVGVGMADQGMGVGDLHAAEPDAVAGSEAVGVEALADPQRAGRAGDQFGHGEILRIGELGERRIAGNQHHLAAGPLDHDGFVGRLLAGRPGGVGGLQRAEPEALRRLRPPQTGAGRGRDDAAGPVVALERVGERQGEDAGRRGLERGQQPARRAAACSSGRAASWISTI